MQQKIQKPRPKSSAPPPKLIQPSHCLPIKPKDYTHWYFEEYQVTKKYKDSKVLSSRRVVQQPDVLQDILDDNQMIKKYRNNYILNYWTLKKNKKQPGEPQPEDTKIALDTPIEIKTIHAPRVIFRGIPSRKMASDPVDELTSFPDILTVQQKPPLSLTQQKSFSGKVQLLESDKPTSRCMLISQIKKLKDDEDFTTSIKKQIKIKQPDIKQEIKIEKQEIKMEKIEKQEIKIEKQEIKIEKQETKIEIKIEIEIKPPQQQPQPQPQHQPQTQSQPQAEIKIITQQPQPEPQPEQQQQPETELLPQPAPTVDILMRRDSIKQHSVKETPKELVQSATTIGDYNTISKKNTAETPVLNKKPQKPIHRPRIKSTVSSDHHNCLQETYASMEQKIFPQEQLHYHPPWWNDRNCWNKHCQLRFQIQKEKEKEAALFFCHRDDSQIFFTSTTDKQRERSIMRAQSAKSRSNTFMNTLNTQDQFETTGGENTMDLNSAYSRLLPNSMKKKFNIQQKMQTLDCDYKRLMRQQKSEKSHIQRNIKNVQRFQMLKNERLKSSHQQYFTNY